MVFLSDNAQIPGKCFLLQEYFQMQSCSFDSSFFLQRSTLFCLCLSSIVELLTFQISRLTPLGPIERGLKKAYCKLLHNWPRSNWSYILLIIWIYTSTLIVLWLEASSTGHICNEDIFSSHWETRFVHLIQVHSGCVGVEWALYWNCQGNVPWMFLHLGYGCVITLKATTASIGDGLPYLPYIALRVFALWSFLTEITDRDTVTHW